MATDPPAPDLGAIRKRLEHQVRHGTASHCSGADIRDLLAAYDEREALLERIRGDSIRLIAAYDAQAAWLAAQKPIVDAVLKLSTYSRETVDDGVQRIVQASNDYEDWLLEHPVGVDAQQYDGSRESALAIMHWAGVGKVRNHGGILQVETADGMAEAHPGDWVIRQPDGTLIVGRKDGHHDA